MTLPCPSTFVLALVPPQRSLWALAFAYTMLVAHKFLGLRISAVTGTVIRLVTIAAFGMWGTLAFSVICLRRDKLIHSKHPNVDVLSGDFWFITGYKQLRFVLPCQTDRIAIAAFGMLVIASIFFVRMNQDIAGI